MNRAGFGPLATGYAAWRIRIGDYRVIYDGFDAELIVTVIGARHRRESKDRY